MRAIWCLVVVSLAIVSAKNLDNIVVFPPQRVPAFVQASSKCIEEMKLDKDILQKYLAWELSDTETTRKYIYCLGHESGYVADDGTLIKDEVLEVVGLNRNKVADAIDECNKSKYNDKYEAIFRIVICFHEKSGLQFKV